MVPHECTEKGTLKEISILLSKLSVSQARTEERVMSLDRRINGSLIKFNDHITQGKGWRMAVVGTIVGVALQVILFAYMYGGLSKTVSVNERIITRELLQKEDHV